MSMLLLLDYLAEVYTRPHPDVDLTEFKGLRREITDTWLMQEAGRGPPTMG